MSLISGFQIGDKGFSCLLTFARKVAIFAARQAACFTILSCVPCLPCAGALLTGLKRGESTC